MRPSLNIQNAAPGEGWALRIGDGNGITVAGESIVLSAPVTATLASLHGFQEMLDTGPPQQEFGVIVLEPVFIKMVNSEIANDAEKSNGFHPIDPDDYPYTDQIRIDGVRLNWVRVEFGAELSADAALERNVIANNLFTSEALAGGNLAATRWSATGVPVGLVRLSAERDILFLDRNCVVRSGGIANRGRQLMDGSGNDLLRQARFEQFLEQLQDLRLADTLGSSASANFRYLPPAGLLPADLIDFATLRMPFLPPGYTVKVSPVPTEQFETALEQSISLEPFDLEVDDFLELLVPVPQRLYEPRLLLRDEISPVFDQTIHQSTKRLRDVEATLDHLNAMAPQVVGAIEHESISTISSSGSTGTAAPVTDFGARSSREVSLLHKYAESKQRQFASLPSPTWDKLVARLDPDTIGQPAFPGVRVLLTQLEALIGKANDAIDAGFLRLQTDIYRVRQNLLSAEDASRLGTSPVLAMIAQVESSIAANAQINDYFTGLKSQTSSTATRSGGAFAPRDFATSVSMPALSVTSGRFTTTRTQPAELGFAVEVPTKEDIDQVRFQSPLTGKVTDFRTMTIAERLKQPPANEAKNYAVATKADIVRIIQALDIELAGLPVPSASGATVALSSKVFSSLTGATQELIRQGSAGAGAGAFRQNTALEVVVIDVGNLVLEDNQRSTLARELASQPALQLTHPPLAEAVQSGLFDPDAENADTAAMLLAGVGALESAVAMLRLVEGRLRLYSALLDQTRKSYAGLNEIYGDWRKVTRDFQNQEAELDHDLALTNSLKAEEQGRIDGVNARRQAILRDHVDAVAFVRPRAVNVRRQVARTPLYPVFEDPVPPCLKRDGDPPRDLQAMIDVLREVPLSWLKYSETALLQFNKPAQIFSIYSAAKPKAPVKQSFFANQTNDVQTQAFDTLSQRADAVMQVVGSYQTVVYAKLQKQADANLAILAGHSWSTLVERAREDLSLNDLIESNGSKIAVARTAISELARIEDVATCLYERFGDVRPELRVQWARKISVFDTAPDLRALNVLPGWAEVDYEQRRNLQRLTDWLFSRIAPGNDAATAFASDLVRVCILLASHAPVASILAAQVSKPVTGIVGDIFTIAIAKGEPRIGMRAAVYNGSITHVEGVVEEIVGEEAIVRVTHAHQATFVAPAGAAVKLFQPPGLFQIT